MNRRQKKKQKQKYLDKITAHVKDALAAGDKIKKESNPVINTARILAGRRKKCQINGWRVHHR